jgi:hypothetical protein
MIKEIQDLIRAAIKSQTNSDGSVGTWSLKGGSFSEPAIRE